MGAAESPCSRHVRRDDTDARVAFDEPNVAALTALEERLQLRVRADVAVEHVQVDRGLVAVDRADDDVGAGEEHGLGDGDCREAAGFPTTSGHLEVSERVFRQPLAVRREDGPRNLSTTQGSFSIDSPTRPPVGRMISLRTNSSRGSLTLPPGTSRASRHVARQRGRRRQRLSGCERRSKAWARALRPRSR